MTPPVNIVTWDTLSRDYKCTCRSVTILNLMYCYTLYNMQCFITRPGSSLFEEEVHQYKVGCAGDPVKVLLSKNHYGTPRG